MATVSRPTAPPHADPDRLSLALAAMLGAIGIALSPFLIGAPFLSALAAPVQARLEATETPGTISTARTTIAYVLAAALFGLLIWLPAPLPFWAAPALVVATAPLFFAPGFLLDPARGVVGALAASIDLTWRASARELARVVAAPAYLALGPLFLATAWRLRSDDWVPIESMAFAALLLALAALLAVPFVVSVRASVGLTLDEPSLRAPASPPGRALVGLAALVALWAGGALVVAAARGEPPHVTLPTWVALNRTGVLVGMHRTDGDEFGVLVHGASARVYLDLVAIDGLDGIAVEDWTVRPSALVNGGVAEQHLAAVGALTLVALLALTLSWRRLGRIAARVARAHVLAVRVRRADLERPRRARGISGTLGEGTELALATSDRRFRLRASCAVEGSLAPSADPWVDALLLAPRAWSLDATYREGAAPPPGTRLVIGDAAAATRALARQMLEQVLVASWLSMAALALVVALRTL